MLSIRVILPTALLLAASVALATAPSAAASAEAGQRSGVHRGFQQWLGLSDDQAKAISEIQARYAEPRKQLWQSLRLAQVDVRQLALSGADETALQPKLAEVEKLLAQEVLLRVKILQEMAPHLTPEQREKLAQVGHGMRRHHPRS